MSKERTETTIENANHVKLLAAKLLTILLHKRLVKTFREGYSSIYSHSIK